VQWLLEQRFAAARRTFDPNNRLLNDYFRGLPGE
jgi:FAD/FMN-containing dehydrogenase